MESGHAALASLGLSEQANRSVRELSMGQRRRAVLAMAWIGSPRVLLLDDPLEALDRGIRDDLLARIERKVSEGGTVIVSTHDLEPFVRLAARVVTLGHGVCKILDPLPADSKDRQAILEPWARGEVR